MTTEAGTRKRFSLREEPKEAYLTDLAAGLTTMLSSSVDKFLVQDTYYNDTFTVWKQKNRKALYTGKGAAIVRQAVDTQFAYDAKVHREPVGHAENAGELADEVEVWETNLFKSVALDMHTPPIKQFNFNMVLHGKAFLDGPRFLAYPQDDEDKPKREPEETPEEYEARMAAWRYDRDNWNPFTMRSPHPRDVLCDPWARTPDEVILRRTLYAYQLAALTERNRVLGRKVDLYEADKRFEKKKLEEYWSRYWHILKIQGGGILVAERNTWGFVPIQQRYSTLGWEQTDDGIADPADLCGGLLDNIQNVLWAIAQNASAAHNQNIRKAYASRVTKSSGAPIEQALASSERGEDITGIDPEDLQVLQYPDVGPSLREEQDRLEAYAQDGTYTPALLGIHQSGVKTLGEAQINSRAASRKFQAIAQNDEVAATVWGENVLRLMDAFGEDMTMRGVTIGREHIKHIYALKVEFDNADFLTQQQERADVREDFSAGIIDEETARARLGYEDETEMRDRKIKQLARQDPRYIRKLVDGTLSEMGMSPEEMDAGNPEESGQGAPPPRRPVPVGGRQQLYGPDGQPIRGG